jgi:hypothetical protein
MRLFLHTELTTEPVCCGAPTDSCPTMAANSFGLRTGDVRRRFEPMPGVFSIVGGATARGCGGSTRGDEVGEAAAKAVAGR